MISDDLVKITALPTGGMDDAQRRLFSPKGEMAQILNNTMSVRHLVYWDLNSDEAGEMRGNHYHRLKTEQYYVLKGELDLLLLDPGTSERAVRPVKAGDRITVAPGVAHAFRSRGYAQVLEFSPEPYNSSDTVPCQVE